MFFNEIKNMQLECSLSMLSNFIKNLKIKRKLDFLVKMVNLLIIKEDQKTSKLDFKKSLFKQINLLRIVDNENYPAFFFHEKKSI